MRWQNIFLHEVAFEWDKPVKIIVYNYYALEIPGASGRRIVQAMC
jgi:hypothetical protein